MQIANGNSRVYYQALDGSIRELLGIGSPGPNRIYFDQILLPAGRARIGTPIAAIDTSTALAIVSLTPLPSFLPLFLLLLSFQHLFPLLLLLFFFNFPSSLTTPSTPPPPHTKEINQTKLTKKIPKRLYYISPDDRLREYIYDTRWRDGTLNNANITTRSGTRYLWAMTVPNLVRPRVGYVAPNGDLSEVALDGSEWVRNIF